MENQEPVIANKLILSNISNIFSIDINTAPEYESFSDFEQDNTEMYHSFLEIIEKNSDYGQFPKHLKNDEIYKLIAPKYSLYSKIISIGVSFYNEKENAIITKSIFGEEKEILQIMNTKIFSRGFYILGYKNETYDLPFIFQRMVKHNIIPSSAVYSPNMKPWDLKIYDINKLWKFNGSYFATPPLKILANFLKINHFDIFDEDEKVTQWWFSGDIENINSNTRNNSVMNMLIYIKLMFGNEIDPNLINVICK